MNCANHPDRERVAFCQHCGKAICQECVRNVGNSIFCESCLQEKLSGAGQPAGAAPYSGAPLGAAPPLGNEPNPALAGLLGVIPGVGAMYNGQFAKGIVHLVIFAVLVSLSHDNGIFGLFIAGWVLYQIFEAYHTARARRDGTPLPNPFGLNDIGEKLGFGRAWPAGAPTQPGTPPQNPAAGAAPYTPPADPNYSPYAAPPAASWSAPANPAASQAWNWENYVPPQPPAQPYAAPPFSPVDPNTALPRNRFPAGAIWLIALGLIFLAGNSHWMFGLPMRWFLPFLLIAFGVWMFVRRMTEYGAPLADDGTALYRFRLFHAAKSSVWIVLIGILFLLDSYNILSWGRSWPLFIIVAGLMAVFRGMAFSGAGPYPPYAPPQAPPAAPQTPPAEPSDRADHIVPPDTHDEGGN